jgi:hypothetical protein
MSEETLFRIALAKPSSEGGLPPVDRSAQRTADRTSLVPVNRFVIAGFCLRRLEQTA